MFLQMEYYNLQRESFPEQSFWSNLSDSEGWHLLWPQSCVWFWSAFDPWTHTSALFLYGKLVRVNLLRESSSNIVMLPGVSQVEVETFILEIYCQNIATENKYSKQQ